MCEAKQLTVQEMNYLNHIAYKVRKGILDTTHAAKSGHPGKSLGAADIFTYLYFKEINIDSVNPHSETCEGRMRMTRQRKIVTEVTARQSLASQTLSYE